MKKRDYDDSRMLDATLGIFAEDPGIAEGKPVLLKVVTDLRNVRSVLHVAINNQISLTKGLSADKVIKAGNLVTKAMNVCTAGLDYAYETENAHLEAIMDVNESALSNLPQPALVSACEVIYAAASSVSAELVSYGLTTEDLDDFQFAITVFKASLEHALVALAGRIAATSEIPALLRKAKVIMKKRLDRQMKQFRKGNPEVYKRYRAARKVRRLGVRHERVEGVEMVEATARATATEEGKCVVLPKVRVPEMAGWALRVNGLEQDYPKGAGGIRGSATADKIWGHFNFQWTAKNKQ